MSQRVCQSCKEGFEITADDFAFYEKMQVPPPTWCPDCRQQRRLSYYVNILKPKMYARTCDATGKKLVSMFPPNAKFPVYDRSYWFSDNWDPMSYGRDYDFSRSFFEQFSELQRSVPRYHTYNVKSENCEFSKAATNSKNCYLVTGWNNDGCMYGSTVGCKDVSDCWFMEGCELCYSCVNCDDCFRVAFSMYAYKCTDSAFLYDCRSCTNCFGCVNLRNKSYYIFNKPYSKEAYEREIKKYDLTTHEGLNNVRKKFLVLKQSQPHVFAMLVNVENVIGDNVHAAEDLFQCFDSWQMNRCKYVALAGLNMSEAYDCYDAGTESSLMYECVGAGGNLNNIRFALYVISQNYNVTYSDMITDSHDLFGCVGLTKKSYCILNKQYTREAYEKLVPQIIEHMNTTPYVDSVGREFRFGEYFPPSLSPFSYTDTAGDDLMPMTQEYAQSHAYSWDHFEETSHAPTLSASDIPNLSEASEDITKEIIQDQQGHSYRIIHQELQLLQKMGVALPNECPVCRFKKRVAQRNPMKLWERSCQCQGIGSGNHAYTNKETHTHGDAPCANVFKTSFAPDRPEIVYCKQCFEKELY